MRRISIHWPQILTSAAARANMSTVKKLCVHCKFLCNIAQPLVFLRRVLVVFLTLLLIVQPVLAKTPTPDELSRAEAKALEAKAYYKNKLFQEAATGFMEAFAISGKPDMMFNAARAYEEAGQNARAIALYEQYITLKNVPDDGKKEAQGHIDKLRKMMADPTAPEEKKPEAEKKPSEAKAPVTAEAEQNPADSPNQPPAKPMVVAVTQKPAAPADDRSRVLSWTLLIGGGLLTLGGLGNTVGGASDANTANNMDFSVTDAAAVYKANYAAASSKRNTGLFSALLGAGLATWGVYRLWGPVPQSTAEKTSNYHWLPSIDLNPAAGSASLIWGGTF